jgi:hypothetical protein
VPVVQPQTPLARQALPAALPVHVTHSPLLPHAVSDVPSTHVPPLQQPFAHGSDGEQAPTQTPVEVLQVPPCGQSVEEAQPH